MKLAFVKTTKFGGWIAVQNANGVCDDGFARVYTNKPQTREADPTLEKLAALMISAPELADALAALTKAVELDCQASSASAEQFAPLIEAAHAALAKAGA
ncbi:hypothetical protein [Caballeronia zhejiangensis]|uniref:hypothetical protein n=1 Tax=Caballeronia zhejiangensis TaxID=871203 RepID=UPI00054F1FB8|nr:hypothetical protein [Caballeronia zhejiangensis]